MIQKETGENMPLIDLFDYLFDYLFLTEKKKTTTKKRVNYEGNIVS